MKTSPESLAIIGSGTMGHSIALSAAMAGFEVAIWGTSLQDIQRGIDGVAEKMEVLSEYGGVQADEKETIAARIRFTTSLQECVRGASFIIEGIPEQLELKQKMFQDLEALCPPDAILASNTSGLSPTAIASLIDHPERTLVTHFWNPGHLIPLVEVIRGEKTSEAAVDRAMALLEAMGKKPILVRRTFSGQWGIACNMRSSAKRSTSLSREPPR